MENDTVEFLKTKYAKLDKSIADQQVAWAKERNDLLRQIAVQAAHISELDKALREASEPAK